MIFLDHTKWIAYIIDLIKSALTKNKAKSPCVFTLKNNVYWFYFYNQNKYMTLGISVKKFCYMKLYLIEHTLCYVLGKKSHSKSK